MPRNNTDIRDANVKTEILELRHADGQVLSEQEKIPKSFYGRIHCFLGDRPNSTIYKDVISRKEFDRRVMSYPYGEDRSRQRDYKNPEFSFVIGVAFALRLSLADANRLLDSANLGQLHPWRTELRSRGDEIVLRYYENIVEKLGSPDTGTHREGNLLIEQMNRELLSENYETIMWDEDAYKDT